MHSITFAREFDGYGDNETLNYKFRADIAELWADIAELIFMTGCMLRSGA